MLRKPCMQALRSRCVKWRKVQPRFFPAHHCVHPFHIPGISVWHYTVQRHCSPTVAQSGQHNSSLPTQPKWTQFSKCSGQQQSVQGIHTLWYSWKVSCTRAKSLELRTTLCKPLDCSPPGASVHRIVKARILEWVAVSSQYRDWTHISHISCIGRQVLYHF